MVLENKQNILQLHDIYDYYKKDIDDVISIQSMNFNKFGLSWDYLDLGPKLWNGNDKYKKKKTNGK